MCFGFDQMMSSQQLSYFYQIFKTNDSFATKMVDHHKLECLVKIFKCVEGQGHSKGPKLEGTVWVISSEC